MTTRAEAASKRLAQAKKTIEKEGDKVAKRVEECLRKIGFCASYAEAAAEEMANDWMEQLESGEELDLPSWLEPGEGEESEEEEDDEEAVVEEDEVDEEDC